MVDHKHSSIDLYDPKLTKGDVVDYLRRNGVTTLEDGETLIDAVEKIQAKELQNDT